MSDRFRKHSLSPDNKSRPWATLDPKLSDHLRPGLDEAIEAVIAGVAREVPAYRPSAGGALEQNLRAGVQIALSGWLELLGVDSPALDAESRQVYERLGAAEDREGRQLDDLQAAYRTGARVAWGAFARQALASGVEPEDLVGIAEAIFAYIDELAAASVAGHTAHQTRKVRRQDIVRTRLAEELLAGAALSAPGRVRDMAKECGWTLPKRLAVALVPNTQAPAPQAPADALVIQREDEALAILPDPSGPGRRARLTAGFRGEVYVGTVRPPEEAAISLEHARRVRGLVERGVLARRPIVAAADHLLELAVTADRAIADELVAKALRPLDEVSEAKRPALAATLRQWLLLHGDRQRVADALHVHPQTVSYRMARLEELFGDALEEPNQRLALSLALLVSDG